MTEGEAINAAWNDYLDGITERRTTTGGTANSTGQALQVILCEIACVGVALAASVGMAAAGMPTWAQFVPFAALVPVAIVGAFWWQSAGS